MSKAQYQINQGIESLLIQKRRSGEAFSREDLAHLNRFSGYGGMAKFGAKGKGLLSEYFTPFQVIEKMVGLAWQYGYDRGAVLEPSCGIGRFLHYFSPETEVEAYEINETSYEIARLNFPTFDIQKSYFNELFIERNGKAKTFQPRFELVIGNPPYGDFIGKFTTKERRLTGATRYEEYFITRGLDVLKKGGLLIFVIPSSFLDGGNSAVKKAISQKAKLLDAYRLPKGIFKQTDIQTDIVVFQKL